MQAYVNRRLVRALDGLAPLAMNVVELSKHPDLTLEVLEAYPNIGWAFHTLATHPNFTFEWVLRFPTRYWDWNQLSEQIDIDIIARHPSMFWNWRLVTDRTHFRDMMRHPDLPWDFNMLLLMDVTEEHIPFLEMFIDRIPDWKWIRIAKCTRWSVFKRAMHLPWLWYVGDMAIDEFMDEDIEIVKYLAILCNWIKLTIHVPVHIINANPELPWNYEFLPWNKSTWNTTVEPVEVAIRRWTAANTIKRHWRRSISDPSFLMCRRRLLREFKDLEC